MSEWGFSGYGVALHQASTGLLLLRLLPPGALTLRRSCHPLVWRYVLRNLLQTQFLGKTLRAPGSLWDPHNAERSIGGMNSSRFFSQNTERLTLEFLNRRLCYLPPLPPEMAKSSGEVYHATLVCKFKGFNRYFNLEVGWANLIGARLGPESGPW